MDASRWQGPLQSEQGWHLVLLTAHAPERDPALAEVRAQVRDDLLRGLYPFTLPVRTEFGVQTLTTGIFSVWLESGNAGGAAPKFAKNESTLKDAHDIEALKRCQIIITAQGGDYTSEVFPKLRREIFQLLELV